MRPLIPTCGAIAVVFCVYLASVAQELDSNVTSESRGSGKITDQISDKTEDSAFLNLDHEVSAKRKLEAAQAFIQKFPQSAFLAQALEIEARSSFDEGDYEGGLEQARRSLALLPENPLLLVAVADVEARQSKDEAAIASAREALEYFERFARPRSVAENEWPGLKLRQQASAHFVIGRAELHKGLLEASPELRRAFLAESIASLAQAHSLNPADDETTYLLGVAQLNSGESTQAAGHFAAVYAQGGAYAAKALAALRQIYHSISPRTKTDFESFLKDAESGNRVQNNPPVKATVERGGGSTHPLGDYAGSAACKLCHRDVYENWAQTGMARMLRPYQPQNVIGDFERNNEYFTGVDSKYLHGRFTGESGGDRQLFARMVVRNGRQYFDIKQADGQWHSYPVDYTIGSKWQQAYATKLPNGQIHVFPIQYNVREKRWLNYWKSLDSPHTERSDPYNFERFDQATNYQANCAICHTSQLHKITGQGKEPSEFEFREPGVGCEMCHGPSALHIASIASGKSYDKGPLDPPVDFQKIGNRDFVKICAQCHMQSALRDPGPQGELNYSRDATFFQNYLSIPFDEFNRTAFYKDGRFGQTTFIVEALERSQCFRKGKVSCGNCHDPHSHDFSTNQTSLKFKDQPDRMCTGCHDQFRDVVKATEHTHHPGNSEGSRCISCHMPAIMDALAFGARTHQVDDIPNAEMTLRFGQQDSPNACLLCHTKKTANWVQEQLLAWKRDSMITVGVERTRSTR
jgi:predicted CXXCH cytochrome family protein